SNGGVMVRVLKSLSVSYWQDAGSPHLRGFDANHRAQYQVITTGYLRPIVLQTAEDTEGTTKGTKRTKNPDSLCVLCRFWFLPCPPRLVFFCPVKPPIAG